ncbi:TPA: helix-turn-helix domain-containing protein [Providencia alcalifaciens]
MKIKKSNLLQENIIMEIILWIENNIETKLTLDAVTSHSGYSKWHFQRMFRNYTGLALGAYIRARRLSCAAVALRMTNDSIFDIAIKYFFDSQQTFTRAFKQQFNITPSRYRTTDGFKLDGFCLPAQKENKKVFQSKLIRLPELSLVAMEHKYKRNINRWISETDQLRLKYWRDFHERNKVITKNLYAINDVDSSDLSGQSVLYMTALSVNEIESSHKLKDLKKVKIHRGDYIEIKFTGDAEEIDFKDIFHYAYGELVPGMDIIRADGRDIERYVLKTKVNYQDFMDNPYKYIKELRYYIPVILK